MALKRMIGMKAYEKELILKEFFQTRPELRPIGEIESGNQGFAIALSNGHHLKITSDKSEVKVCKALIGRKNKFLCDIFEVGSFYSSSQDYHFSWIIMEHLYKNEKQQWINEAFKDFRYSWLNLFLPRIIDHLTWTDLWLIYKRNETDKINRTRKLLPDYLSNINEERLPIEWLSEREIEKRLERAYLFFDFFENAYKELLAICPSARIDLNEGNFMFDINGNIKTLDIQSEDV